VGDTAYHVRNLLIEPEESEESEETIISSVESRYDSISSLDRQFRTQILTLVARRLRIVSYHRERRYRLLTRLSRRLRALSGNNAPRIVDLEIAGVTVTAKAAKNASKANSAVHSKTEQNGMDEASRSKIYEQAKARMKSGFFRPLSPTAARRVILKNRVTPLLQRILISHLFDVNQQQHQHICIHINISSVVL
jgi:hypothetical protein